MENEKKANKKLIDRLKQFQTNIKVKKYDRHDLNF